MYSAADREITGPALGSGAEDTFWWLVCEDEEWLRAEFDAIVSAITETPRLIIHRPNTIGATRPWGSPGHGGRDPRPVGGIGDRPERHLSRERSPPELGHLTIQESSTECSL